MFLCLCYSLWNGLDCSGVVIGLFSIISVCSLVHLGLRTYLCPFKYVVKVYKEYFDNEC